MKLRFVCSIALLMFVSMLFAGADPFTAKLGNPKHEIVDSLLAVDELSGSIYYQQNYLTVDANWQEGLTYIGDYYSWAWMVRFASIGYLSFELPIIPDGYKLQIATLSIYVQAMKGDNTLNAYPVFNYGNTSVFPEGIMEHIDYGDTFNSIDVIPSSIFGTYSLFSYDTLMPHSWLNFDLTNCIVLDISSNRSHTQYRFYLDGYSDWDNREDFVIYGSHSSPYGYDAPKITYVLTDGTSAADPTIPQIQLTVSCYPNPFSDTSSITVKAPEPGLYNLNIYNIKGQKIRSFGKSSQSSGDHIFHWDGRDDTGRQVSGGIYFAVVEAGKYKASSKILYVK